jgi:hypothetical protein
MGSESSASTAPGTRRAANYTAKVATHLRSTLAPAHSTGRWSAYRRAKPIADVRAAIAVDVAVDHPGSRPYFMCQRPLHRRINIAAIYI